MQRGDFGPKMMALSPRHRAAVLAYLQTNNKTEAVRLAGYTDGPASKEAYNAHGPGSGLRKQGYRVFNRQDVCEAILEETRRRIEADLPANVDIIRQMAENPQTKDATRFNAAKWLAQQAGMRDVVENKTSVEITIEQRVREIQEMGKVLGMSQEQIERLLIGSVSDAEFVELAAYTPPTEDELEMY